MLTGRDIVGRVLQGRRPVDGGIGEAFAPANIALCKYWGKRNRVLNLPVTSSLSVSLGALGSATRLGLRSDAGAGDRVVLNGKALAPDHAFVRRVSAFLDLFRADDATRYALETRNTIPTAAGFASSASGFASLVMALDRLHGWELPVASLSILARLGSGSACRSVCRGLVEWQVGVRDDGMDSFASPIVCAWPQLRLGLLVLATGRKPIGSREAMRRTVETSQLYGAWPGQVARDLAALKCACRERDMTALGETAESNALAMHGTMMAAVPPVLYWLPESVAAMRAVWQARAEGICVYFTMDAGPNLKLLFTENDEDAVREHFTGIQIVEPLAAED